jgi:hypothetical protein
MMNIKPSIKKRIKYLVNSSSSEQIEKLLTITAQIQLLQNSKLDKIADLTDVEVSAFSQWGEDGIIDWIITRIPGIPKTFIEFGVENYREANTRLLLLLRNWRGLVLDASESNIREIKSQEIYWRHALSAQCAFINRDNINDLIKNGSMIGEVGLLSIDIDGNDYWIWQAINIINPVIGVVEYNAVFGDIEKIVVPYRSDFVRTRAHSSNLYFGASLAALIDLGTKRGYNFIGTNKNGSNAFFVRNELVGEIKKSIRKMAGYPSAFRESRSANGELAYDSGLDRIKIIEELPIIHLESGTVMSLSRLSAIYSPDWAANRDREF